MSASENRIPFRLNDRDEEILEHIRRYRISTKEVLHGLFFADSEPPAVLKVMRRLTKAGYVSTHEPEGLPQYFRVGPETVRMMGLNKKSCDPHGVQALPVHLGVLLLCCTGERRPKRLTQSEISRSKPELLIGKQKRVIYLTSRDENRPEPELCIARVDLGGSPLHVARQCEGDIKRLAENEAILDYIKRERFVVELVTTSREKALQIGEAITRRNLGVPVRLSTEPSLAPYIVRPLF